MRGNNKRKLVSGNLIPQLLESYQLGVPLSKLIANNQLDISSPHLRKLLFIYIEILDPGIDMKQRSRLYSSLFPIWLEDKVGAYTQPDEWTYDGRFPNGTWRKKDV